MTKVILGHDSETGKENPYQVIAWAPEIALARTIAITAIAQEQSVPLWPPIQAYPGHPDPREFPAIVLISLLPPLQLLSV